MPRAIWNGQMLAESDDTLVVEGNQTNHDAAWYYPEPQPAAAAIRDRVAFWKGVRVEA